MKAQISADKPEASTSASVKYRSKSVHTYVYTQASIWSHIIYGLGMLALIVIPPLIPGVSRNTLIMGYMEALLAVFTIVGVWGIVRSLQDAGNRR